MLRLMEIPRCPAALITLLCIAASQAGTSALAHDHLVPRATVQIGDQQQLGRVWTSSWVSSSGNDGCAVGGGDGTRRFRKGALEFSSPARIRFVVWKRQHPRALVISEWHEVDENGVPQGNRKRRDPRLKPISSGGEVRAWSARLRLARARSYYLEARGRWADVEGCRGVQEAAWLFHLEGS